MPPTVLEMAKDLVLAQIRSGALLPANMQEALRRTHQSLLELKSREESSSPVPETPQAPADWRKSITRLSITCMECGAAFKQLSLRHLRQHDLDGRLYRQKYGIPRTQPLAARATTAKRKEIVQRTRPWELAPSYIEAQAKKSAAAKKSGRKKATSRL